jgi:hypothetical protein
MPANFNNNILVRFESVDVVDNTITLTRDVTLYDAWAITNGGGGGTVQFFVTSSAGTAITDAMSIAADETLDRAATIDVTANTLASGSVLCVTKNAAVSSTTYALFSATGVTLT